MKLDDLRARLRRQEERHPGLMCSCGKLATKCVRFKLPAFECECGMTIVEGPTKAAKEVICFMPGIDLSLIDSDGRAQMRIAPERALCESCQTAVRIVWAEGPKRFELECPECSGANLLGKFMSMSTRSAAPARRTKKGKS